MKLFSLTIVFAAGCILPIWSQEGARQDQMLQLKDLAGFKAKIMCSCVFISKRDPATVEPEDVAIANPYITVDIDREKKTVTCLFQGNPLATAVFREGLGCTLTNGIDAAALRDQYPDPPEVVFDPLKPWPMGDTRDFKVPPGIDGGKLKTALDHAFGEYEPGIPQRTRAVLIVYKGIIIAERYAAGFTRDTPLMGWSMTKSVTNALTGILVKRGLLKLDDPLPVPEWAEGDPRKAITLRHVLHMSSGLTFQEVYEPGTDVVGMLFRHHSAATFVAGKDLGAPPGTKWYYSSGTTNLLARALRLAMGDNHRDYLALPRTALFNKIGMSSAVIEPDPSGHFIGSSFSYATARDWARLGLLYLNDGVWDGERILPEGWVAFSRQAAPAAPEGRYGAHFWTNLGSDETGKDRPWPYLPRDTFNMEGFEGQRVIMIPSMELVIVRLGQTPSNGRFHFPRLTREILAALPVVNK